MPLQPTTYSAPRNDPDRHPSQPGVPTHGDCTMNRRALLACSAFVTLGVGAHAQTAHRIAVDILLEPGPSMLERATADNARLRGNHPEGFALDSAHTPHITVLQAFVDAADLARVGEAAARVLDAASPLAWQLTAIGRYYLPTNGLGLAGITIRPIPALLSLQAELVAAMAPFTRQGAGADAFDGPAPPALLPATVAYINGFVPERTGANYNPHVTTGLGREDFVRAMVAEPFPAFAFGLTGASLFHLGILGTANRRLWTWSPQSRT